MRTFALYLPCLILALGLAPAAFAAAPAEKPAGEPAAEAAAPAPVRRIPDTLMFSIDELTDVQSRISTTTEGEQERDPSVIENATLYLSTILYTGPNDWTIWLNGKPIGPNQELGSEFTITSIGPRFVELLVPLSAQGMRPVRLEPNQTFIARSGAVVEGQWR